MSNGTKIAIVVGVTAGVAGVLWLLFGGSSTDASTSPAQSNAPAPTGGTSAPTKSPTTNYKPSMTATQQYSKTVEVPG